MVLVGFNRLDCDVGNPLRLGMAELFEIRKTKIKFRGNQNGNTVFRRRINGQRL